MVDYCNMDEHFESSFCLVYYMYQESQGLLTVVVDRTFASWSVDLRTSLFTDHRHVILLLRVKFSQLISTAKLF